MSECEEQIGGDDLKDSLNSKTSFFQYITTFSSKEKNQLLNLIQYGGLTIIPILIILKLMKMYVPQEDPFKSSTELVVEVLLQLLVIIVSFFVIHKLVLYVPTYSKLEYDSFSLLSGVLPLFFLMFTLDTKVSEKLNILFDRLLITLGIKKEPYQNKKESLQNETPNNSQGMQSETQDRLIGGFPTKRDPTPPTMNTSLNSMLPQSGNEMYELNEPMAANETCGSMI